MPSAYVETPFARVKLHSERLLVLAPPEPGKPDELLQQIPVADLERLILHEQVQITTQAVCALFRASVPLHYIDTHGHQLGASLPPAAPDTAFRLRQYRRTLDTEFAISLARRLVQAKIPNQHRLLQKANANRPRGIETELEQFPAFQTQAGTMDNLDQLRGVEGASTVLYFRLWAQFLPPEFPFERRSSRPPGNPVNACISFGSALVYQEVVAAIHLRGLDPGLGLLHQTENDRWSLALDLMEPFRPAIMEALTLRLFSQQILKASDFEPAHGGIYLNQSGRRTYLQHYERRLQREFMSEPLAHRTSLRQQLQQQVLSYKKALEEPDAFTPFRLN